MKVCAITPFSLLRKRTEKTYVRILYIHPSSCHIRLANPVPPIFLLIKAIVQPREDVLYFSDLDSLEYAFFLSS